MGYRLDVSPNNTFSSYVNGWQDLDVGSVVSRSVTGLNAGRPYYYRVRAYNSGGTSGNSGTISVTNIPAAPVANPAGGLTSSGFTANWSSAIGATGYRLDVSTNVSFANYLVGCQNLDVGSVYLRKVTGLTSGTVYYYRVRAYNGSGTSTHSATVAVTTMPILAFAWQGSNLVLSWPTNDPAFKLYFATNFPATTWSSNPAAPSIVNWQYAVTNRMTNHSKFYRLKK